MLNDNRPIVPPMKNVVGNTHAETRVELAARARAEQAAAAAELAAKEQKANKKSPVSTVLALVFGFLAAAAIGFAVYELLENNKLQEELARVQSYYSDAQSHITTLEDDNSRLKRLNTALQEELDALKTPTEETETTETTDTPTTEPEETPSDSD